MFLRLLEVLGQLHVMQILIKVAAQPIQPLNINILAFKLPFLHFPTYLSLRLLLIVVIRPCALYNLLLLDDVVVVPVSSASVLLIHLASVFELLELLHR